MTLLRFVISYVLILDVTMAIEAMVPVQPVKCNSGMYYDSAIGRCDMCYVLCEFAQIQDTVERCNQKCPDYRILGRQVDYNVPETENQASTTSTSAAVTSPSSSPASLRESPDQPRTIVLLITALSIVVVTMSAAVVVLVMWKVKGDVVYKTGFGRNVIKTRAPVYRNGHFGEHTGGNNVHDALMI